MKGNRAHGRIHRLTACVALAAGLFLTARSDAVRGGEAAPADTTTTQVALEIRTPHFPEWQACDVPGCRAVDSDQPCVACRMWDLAETAFGEDAITVEPHVVDHGVVLRVVSKDAHVQETLWSASVARAQMLEMVRHGDHVPLCAACRANIRAFGRLDIGAQRTPDGVLLVYTSNDPDIVHALQAMVGDGREVPL
jgi:hypothetical protein